MKKSPGAWLFSGAVLATALTAGAAERVFFGDLHLHTRYSNDAWSRAETRTPDDSYRFAKGGALQHVGGAEIRLNTPLDFLGVSDHAGDARCVPLSCGSRPSRRRLGGCAPGRLDGSGDAPGGLGGLGTVHASPRPEPGALRPGAGSGHLGRDRRLADRHYAPGEFTTFAAFEWTSSTPDFGNLHRVVVFEGRDDLPHPYSPRRLDPPRGPLVVLEAQRMRGVDAIAIPHNATSRTATCSR